jgi:hypothetical protein
VRNRGSFTTRAWCRGSLAAGILILAAACSGDSPTEASNINSPAPIVPESGNPVAFAVGEAGNGSGQCLLADVVDAGFVNSGEVQCTSNDVDISFAEVTYYSINDPDPAGGFLPLPTGQKIDCVPNDVIYAVTSAQILNNASERYDFGLWINPDETAPLGTGALTGNSCLHFNLVVGDPGVANIDATPDQCGDINSTTSVVNVPLDTLTLVCPAGGATTVTVDACAAWANGTTGSNDRICPVTEDGEGDPVTSAIGFRLGTTPGTPAKCRCEPLVLPINVKGVIRVDKVTVPSGAGQSFDFTPTGTGFTTGFALTDAASPHSSGPINAGTYTVTETVPTGWDLTGRACVLTGTSTAANFTETSNGVSVVLASGQDVTCTFTNTQQASLKIIKDAVPDGATDFDFDLTGAGLPADLDLDDDANGTLPNNQTFSNLTPGGTRTVTESATASHTLTNIACTGATNSTVTIGADSDFDAGDTGISVVLAPGENVICTFTNTGNGSITIVKNAVPDAAQDFDFDNTGAGVPADLDLDDDADGTLPSSQTFGDLPAGSRSFTETAVAGWTLTNIQCTGATSSTITIGADSDFDAGDAGVTVGLALGENVTCTFTNTRHSVTVVKTATETFKRGFAWGIVKTANPAGPIDLDPGQVYFQDYDIAVDTTGYTDSAFAVSGNITINNPNAFAVTINSVTDEISGGVGAVSVSCPQTLPYSLAGGGNLVCTYSSSLPDGTTRTNTASVALAGVADPFTDDESVTFVGASPSSYQNNCLAVSDVWNGGAPEAIGTVCVTGTPHSAGAQTAPHTYDMDKEIPTGVAQCGQVTYNNTATGTTNTSGTEVSDDASVVVNILCPQGCTLTQGYWKTHNPQFAAARNGKGPPPDEAWNLITPAGALSGFFTTSNSYPVAGPNAPSFTWFQVFWTAPKGNAYYNLAHQYMAAKLNILDGVTPPAAVAAAITAAEDIFDSYTPAQIGALKANNALRQQIITLAGTLGAFNEGTGDVAHCTEDQTSTLQ